VADDLTRNAEDLTVAATLPSFIAMDLPPLSEDHGSAGLYFALYGPAAGFVGHHPIDQGEGVAMG
jgi:hypothetical protein